MTSLPDNDNDNNKLDYSNTCNHPHVEDAKLSSSLSSPVQLTFQFRGRSVPVTYGPHITADQAQMAIDSEPFQTWCRRCERQVDLESRFEADDSVGGGGGGDCDNQEQDKAENATESTIIERRRQRQLLELHQVELQSIDMFGARGVGFIKLKSHCTLTTTKLVCHTKKGSHAQVVLQEEEDEEEIKHEDKPLPGICFLRGSAVCILVALFCEDDEEGYGLLVEQPRVPIGQVACLEIPAGMVDNEQETIAGTAVVEMKEECGIVVEKPSDLIDLTALAFSDGNSNHERPELQWKLRLPSAAIPPSPGGCDEVVRYFYLEKQVTRQELLEMKGRAQGLRDHGEYITLRVVPLKDLWRISGDAKAMISLFLLEQLRKQELLPDPGCLATPLLAEPKEPTVQGMPQLAFGLYKIPVSEKEKGSGVQIIGDAIEAGYRHFDAAEFYENTAALGKAMIQSGIPRTEFYISFKVWKPALQSGPQAVKDAVLAGLEQLSGYGQKDHNGNHDDCYFDLVMIHWPVPGKFVAAYQALQELHEQGLVRNLGLSNFNADEYQELMQSGVVTVKPICNQMEVSPVMYRPDLVGFYQNRDMIVSAFKVLHRGEILTQQPLVRLAQKYQVTVAQLLLRWGIQHGLVVVSKTATRSRMIENRRVWHFRISDSDMAAVLDQLTTKEAIQQRNEREQASKLMP